MIRVRVVIFATALGFSLAFGCASPLEQIKDAESQREGDELAEHLRHGEFALIREEAARAMGALPPGKRKGTAYTALVDALRKGDENPHVKAACGLTLMRWGATESVPDLIDATMVTSDPEAKYWLAYALHGFKTRETRAALESLREHPDMLLATSAKEWTKEPQ